MSDVKELIQKLSGTWGIALVTTCDATVLSVDKSSRTCVVNCIDSNKTLDKLTVRLSPTVDDGEIDAPEINSVVIIAFTSFTEPYIVRASGISSKDIAIGNQLYHIENGKQIFNDGGFGGIPIVKNPDDSEAGLLSRINKLEQYVSKLQNNFKSWTVAPNDGGAALFAQLNLPVIGFSNLNIQTTTEQQISNPNITHGKSL